MLTQKELKRLVSYEPESGLFTWLDDAGSDKSGKVAGWKSGTGYISIGINSRKYLAHRLAFLYMTGKMPENIVDHADGDKANNRFLNLRQCSVMQNAYNQGLQCSSTGIKSVVWASDKQRWRARMRANGKKHHIGYFKNIEEAELAAIQARENLHGEFARHS